MTEKRAVIEEGTTPNDKPLEKRANESTVEHYKRAVTALEKDDPICKLTKKVFEASKN